MISPKSRDDLARQFAALAVSAGALIMKIYESSFEVRFKTDNSPVCNADEMAEALILQQLPSIMPHVPVVAEEASARGITPRCGDSFLLVDPLDGTREFLAHNGEFTVNIALIEAGRPVAGAIYAPALEKLWFGGHSAFSCHVAPGQPLPPQDQCIALHTRHAPKAGLTALASRSHCNAETHAFLARLPILEKNDAGSSLKFCRLAEGQADVYPRFSPTMEWDTAAGDAILQAAGGVVLDANGAPLHYGKGANHFKNDSFIAWGDPARALH